LSCAKLICSDSRQLNQIDEYIKLIEKIQNNEHLNTLSVQFPAYPAPLQTLMREKDSNLYSMVLRPREQDLYLRSVNPVFSVNRAVIDASGSVNPSFRVLASP